jgi:type I site-specific restriction-modification system R (restriction) subunit
MVFPVTEQVTPQVTTSTGLVDGLVESQLKILKLIADNPQISNRFFFSPYEFFYAWRRVEGLAKDVDGINSLFTLVQGMLNKNRLRDIVRNFILIWSSKNGHFI